MTRKKESLKESEYKPLSAVEAATKYLENKIIHNEFKQGDRLIERKLANLLGISKIPVREALRSLEKSGLVRIEERKGASVAPLTLKEIEDNYTIREHLFGLAARLAARHIQKGELAEIKRIEKKMVEKCRMNDLNAYFSLNLEFSQLLLTICRNNQLNKIMNNLGKQTYRFRFTSMSLPGRMEKSCNHHQLLAEVLENKNEVKAEKIAQMIIGEAGQALIKYISDNKKSSPIIIRKRIDSSKEEIDQ